MNIIIAIKTDTATKRAAESLSEELGLTLDDLVNACLKQVIVSQCRLKIYYPIVIGSKLEKIIEEANQEIGRGDFIGPFSKYDEMVEALDKAVDGVG